MTLREMIMAVQGAYGLRQDGLAGPQTWGAIFRDKVRGEKTPAPAAPSDITVVDERSEKAISTLLPEVRPYARALVHAAAAQGIEIQVISALRTFAEQDALYAVGRFGNKGRRVTNAKGGFSNHNFGIAFDIGLFQRGRYVPASATYRAVGSLGTALGLEWGGNWQTFIDEPHFQLRPAWAAGMSERMMLAELRERRATDIPIFSA